MRLILASSSKNRQNIFNNIGWKYEVITSKEEEYSEATDPRQYVMDLSKDKANSVASQIEGKALIISADSVVYMDGTIFEKPKSKEEAFQNIKLMGGKTAYLNTGMTIKDLYQDKEITFSDVVEVHVRKVDDEDIRWYVENENFGRKSVNNIDENVEKLKDNYNVVKQNVQKAKNQINNQISNIKNNQINKNISNKVKGSIKTKENVRKANKLIKNNFISKKQKIGE